MMDTSTPRASSAWLATWPKRPKPIISTLPPSPSGASTPSVSGAACGSSQRSAPTASGVSAIDRITTAVSTAFMGPSMMPAPCAAVYSTKANSPPCAISTVRCTASAWRARNSRATP